MADQDGKGDNPPPVFENLKPQHPPGHEISGIKNPDSSIPLSIFPISPDRICICFCGLPGRGKTHISRRLGQYLSFFHAVNVKIFNVGEYRRKKFGASQNAEWFDMQNSEALRMREDVNNEALADMIQFFRQAAANCSVHSNSVGILDATNSTRLHRAGIQQELRQEGVNTIWVEVVNDDPSFLLEQHRTAAQTMPDYSERASDWEAEEDYRRRIAAYTNFEHLDSHHPLESRCSFLRCDHTRQHFEVHNIRGHIPLKAAHFLMNIRTTTHSFYLTRHGQSEYNRNGRIGGDSGLSEHGVAYAKALAKFVHEKITVDEQNPEQPVPVRLWTSTLKRTIDTAQFIRQDQVISREDRDDPSVRHEWANLRMRKWPYLDEIFAGACDGMTYQEIEQRMPEEFSRRQRDKLAYRYPRGESYLDVIARVEPMIIEMERHREPLLLIAHQGILRVILAFYTGLDRSQVPHMKIPLNAVIRLQPAAVTCANEQYTLYHPEDFECDGQDDPPS